MSHLLKNNPSSTFSQNVSNWWFPVFVLQADKVHELAESIGKKLAEAEKLGAEGNVEKSMEVMAEVDNIRKQKLEAEVS